MSQKRQKKIDWTSFNKKFTKRVFKKTKVMKII